MARPFERNIQSTYRHKSSCSSLSFVSCAHTILSSIQRREQHSLTSQLFVTDRYVGTGPSSPGQVLFMDKRPTLARVRSRFR